MSKMGKKKFSDKDKAKAVRMMLDGTMTQKQIAVKFGCSLAALQLWKHSVTSAQEDKQESQVTKVQETAAQAEPICECPLSSPRDCSVDKIIRQFWNKNFRAVDMLLEPKDVSQEEVISIVNDALRYACEQLQK